MDNNITIMANGMFHLKIAPEGSSNFELNYEEQTIKPFREVFWEIFKEKKFKYPNPDLNLCYMFELVSPKHMIVVRNLSFLKEENIEAIAKKNNWNYATPINNSFTTYEKLIE